MLRSLADITEKEAHGVAKDFGQSLNGVNPVNDHTVQQSFIENIEAQKAAEANIFRNLADAYKVFGDIGTSIKNVPASYRVFFYLKSRFLSKLYAQIGHWIKRKK